MRWDKFGLFLGIVLVIVAVSVFFLKPLALSIKQGLDLQGGTHVLLEAFDTPETKVDDDAVARTIKILEMRINELGLTEPIVQKQGQKRVIIELPGVKDPEEAIKMIGKTALLEFKDESGNTILTGKDLKTAQASIQNNQSIVSLDFTSEGAKKFGDATGRNIGKRIAILLDGKVLTNPVVQAHITEGHAQITGQRDLEEAKNLAILLRSGALPVRLEILETRSVGPSLGQDSKDKSVKAFTIGIVAVVLFMQIFYRASGFVANVALLLYVLLFLFCLGPRGLGATLTLPGIAGVILSIGMAVDANVLIFERFKEEFHAGKTLRAAMDAGFGRALNTIIDTTATTILASAVLYYFGTGAVRGFAITLALGVFISLFTAVTVTRYMLRLLIHANLTKSGKVFGA